MLHLRFEATLGILAILGYSYLLVCIYVINITAQVLQGFGVK